MEVDHQAVQVLQRFVPVRMAVRLRAFPALVLVVLVLVVDVAVLMLQCLVSMLQSYGRFR